MSFQDKFNQNKPLYLSLFGIIIVIILSIIIFLVSSSTPSPTEETSEPLNEPEFSTSEDIISLTFSDFAPVYRALGQHDYAAFQSEASAHFSSTPNLTSFTFLDGSLTTSDAGSSKTITFKMRGSNKQLYFVEFFLEYIPGGYNSTFTFSET